MSRDPVSDMLSSLSHIRVLQRLASVRPHLSTAEQAIATYLLGHPHEVAEMSAAQLAEAAGVSEATVFRLCRELGYPGYTQLREEVAAAAKQYAPSFLSPVELGGAVQPLGSKHTPLEGQACPDPLFTDVVTATVYNGVRVLIDTVSVASADVEKAAEALLTSRRVILTGVGGYTGRLAEMAAFGLQRLGLTCMVWVDAELRYVTEQLLTPEDAVLGISYSGNNQYVARLLEMANQVGATTLSITNYALSPVAKQSRIALITSFREGAIQNFDLLPRLSQLLIVHMLIDVVREQAGRSTQEGLQAAP